MQPDSTLATTVTTHPSTRAPARGRMITLLLAVVASLCTATRRARAVLLELYLTVDMTVARVVNRMFRRIDLADETGAGLVEYLLIILVVAILIIAVLGLFRKNIANGFNNAGNCISGQAGANGGSGGVCGS